jgi:hypothetical protein
MSECVKRQYRNLDNYRAWGRLNYARHRQKIRERQKADYDDYRAHGFRYATAENGKRCWMPPKPPVGARA